MAERLALTATVAAAAATVVLLYQRRQRRQTVAAAVHAHHAADGEDLYSLSLPALAAAADLPLDSPDFAAALDAADPFRGLRDEFHIPPHRGEEKQAYMAGNSLGLEPRGAAVEVRGELDKWATRGVMGHFEGALPWATCEDALPPLLGELVGAKDVKLEVGAMNSLTVNLHFLMAAFYRPSTTRAAILIEAGAFPSDRYATASQIRHHGFDPSEWLIEVKPRASDSLLHTEDILAAIDANRDRLALVLLGGLNYLTGQVLDMPAIARHMSALNADAASRGERPIPFGLDLAHAIGNVPLQLHEWKVDFAAWCTYKYLNSGAGCLAGMFVHEAHASDSELYPRLAGWWGVPFGKRFEMAHQFDEAQGVAAFGVSNVNMLLVACVHASLALYQKAGGVKALRRKSILLTAYLEALLQSRGLLVKREGGAASEARRSRTTLELVTPSDPRQRGCQLSLRVLPAQANGATPMTMRVLEEAMRAKGVVGDAREPDIMRLAPVPLYNSFSDVLRVAGALQQCLGC